MVEIMCQGSFAFYIDTSFRTDSFLSVLLSLPSVLLSALHPSISILPVTGTHDALVVKLLTARGVPKRYVEVDLSKSKK
jgi:hypothetical protein